MTQQSVVYAVDGLSRGPVECSGPVFHQVGILFHGADHKCKEVGQIRGPELRAGIGSTKAGIESSSQVSGEIKSEENLTYDKMGRVKKSVSDGITTAYEYDFLGREIKTVVSEEGKDDIITVKSYDKNGSLKSESSTAGTSNTYIYDSRNRNTQKFTSGSGIMSRSETVSYSSQTNLEVNTGKGKKRIPFVYVKTTFNSSGQEVSREYTDCEGKAVRTLTGNIFTDQTYDKSGNCTATCSGYISGGVESVDSVSLSLYDAHGNLTAEIKNPIVSDGSFEAGAESIVKTTFMMKKDI